MADVCEFMTDEYCGMHVYEKLDGMSAWLLGFIALRELL
jgi:hypothetical protein